ncbi:uncharacterized protein LOC115086962 isoform X2 [Rhinatrema bivittatum]|uniref:uncharacterized protein LOC115086962 isoform X2 n=1 Tax=Rhinatrema bivittatum TaxID=194408 RepID=UPI00112610BE|nr:uncharacterized protein LOC115086962 isoform X2 [Rhinatrema bivittatum]
MIAAGAVWLEPRCFRFSCSPGWSHASAHPEAWRTLSLSSRDWSCAVTTCMARNPPTLSPVAWSRATSALPAARGRRRAPYTVGASLLHPEQPRGCRRTPHMAEAALLPPMRPGGCRQQPHVAWRPPTLPRALHGKGPSSPALPCAWSRFSSIYRSLDAAAHLGACFGAYHLLLLSSVSSAAGTPLSKVLSIFFLRSKATLPLLS